MGEEGSAWVLDRHKLEQAAELYYVDEDELLRRHDELVQHLNNNPRMSGDTRIEYTQRIAAYRGELQRRQTERQGERMETLTKSLNRLTWWIVALTVVITVATLAGVGVAIWAEFFGG